MFSCAFDVADEHVVRLRIDRHRPNIFKGQARGSDSFAGDVSEIFAIEPELVYCPGPRSAVFANVDVSFRAINSQRKSTPDAERTARGPRYPPNEVIFAQRLRFEDIDKRTAASSRFFLNIDDEQISIRLIDRNRFRISKQFAGRRPLQLPEICFRAVRLGGEDVHHVLGGG